MARQQAEQVLRDRRGSMYDPWVVDEFLRILELWMPAEASHDGGAASASAPLLLPAQLDVISATTAEEREFNELRRELPKATSIAAAADVLFRHLRRVVPASCFALYVPKQHSNELDVLVCSRRWGIHDKGSSHSGRRAYIWVGLCAQASCMNSDATLDLGPVGRTFSVPLKYALAVPVLDGPSVAVITLYGPDLFDKDHRRLVESAADLFISSVPSGHELARPHATRTKDALDLKVH